MREEQLIRVEKFEELKAGMLVAYHPCSWCAGRHRFMLLLRDDRDGIDSSGRILRERSWTHAPSTKCSTADSLPDLLSDVAVSRGRVYRIVEANPQAETTEAATVRPKKRTKAGVR